MKTALTDITDGHAIPCIQMYDLKSQHMSACMHTLQHEPAQYLMEQLQLMLSKCSVDAVNGRTHLAMHSISSAATIAVHARFIVKQAAVGRATGVPLLLNAWQFGKHSNKLTSVAPKPAGIAKKVRVCSSFMKTLHPQNSN
ncbi:TPA: hypothetical protein ACH3X2_013872 [Trebouxia sp. C0005]